IYIYIYTSNIPLSINVVIVDQLPLPEPCDSIKCPPESEIQCPADSSIREMVVDLIKSNAVDLPDMDHNEDHLVAYNSSQISEEDYVQCCLTRKCVCKPCYIPDCDPEKDEIVVELVPEDPHTPGECCGQFECRPEPNCTEVRDTEYQWLRDCQRCRCISGVRICHQSCDEEATAEGRGASNAICEAKNLNKFFKHGDTWVDGCQECECVRGEPKCTISFCGNVNCPSERQVILKDTCCPVCWPKGAPMPHEPRQHNDGYDYKDAESEEIEMGALPPLLPELQTTQQSGDLKDGTSGTSSGTSTSTSSTSSTSTSTTTTPAPPPPTICHCAFDSPKVVEVIGQSDCVFYWLSGYSVLASIVIVALSCYICIQRAKKRSYDPVSILDHSI
ncbi:hypothetical protein KR009_007423, partial [Drosophila setifemur]